VWPPQPCWCFGWKEGGSTQTAVAALNSWCWCWCWWQCGMQWESGEVTESWTHCFNGGNSSTCHTATVSHRQLFQLWVNLRTSSW
jgi:hypothetical protein